MDKNPILQWDEYVNSMGSVMGENERIAQNLYDYAKKLEKALDFYEKERQRFRHANPEITGAYFLSGGYGEKDNNMLPQYVMITPAYGVGWCQVYEKTNKTVNFEGS